MSIRKPEVSKIFPNGYGDFAVQSSDDVICYFPSQILGHVSCVFRDMFDSAGSYDQRGESPIPVKITEPITILELFLTQIDPNLPTNPINPDTIEGLLNMADKYQAMAILNWFKQEVTVRRTDEMSSKVSKALIINHPALVLSLSIRYDLKDAGRYALRQLSGCSEKQLATCPDSLRVSALLEVYRLRAIRITRYHTWIEALTKLPPKLKLQSNRSLSPMFRRRALNSYDEPERTYPEAERSPFRSNTVVPTPPMKVCINCTTNRARWIMAMMMAVQSSPNWSSFIKAYETPVKCSECDLCWPDQFRDVIEAWKQEATREETKLPV